MNQAGFLSIFISLGLSIYFILCWVKVPALAGLPAGEQMQMRESGLDLGIEGPPLEMILFPDETATLEITLTNPTTLPVAWELYEISSTETLLQISQSQWQTDRSPVDRSRIDSHLQLIVDDGVAETFVGYNDSTYGYQFLWLNRFTPAPSDFPFLLEEVQVVFGTSGLGVPLGGQVQLVIFQDIDGDGDPSNAELLTTFTETIQVNDGVTWNVYEVPGRLVLRGPGDVLIGAINRYTQSGTSPRTFPAAIDLSNTYQRSWVGVWNGDPPQPPFLPPDLIWDLIDNRVEPGNWLLRGAGWTLADWDIPWFSEAPTSGIISPQDVQRVSVTFDSSGLTPGDYTAALLLLTDEEADPVVTQPVSMTVIAIVAGVQVEPPSAGKAGDPGEVVEYALSLTNTGNATDTFTVTVGGNAWETSLPITRVTLADGEGVDLLTSVLIPQDALGEQWDRAIVTVTSHHDPLVSDFSLLTTTANIQHGLDLAPAYQQSSADPGSIVEYAIQLHNTGNFTDQVGLFAIGNAWNVILPVDEAELAPNEVMTIAVTVTVPLSAFAGDIDVVLIQVVSLNDSFVTDDAELHTTAKAVYAVGLEADQPELAGFPGSAVTYTLRLTNLGNAEDTISITWQGNTWETDLPVTSVVLPAGAQAELVVIVWVAANARYGEQDSVTITAHSVGNPGLDSSVLLSTTSFYEIESLFLPIIYRSG
jgi:hypothetical protein